MSACNAGDPSSISGLGRCAGEGISYPLQYSWDSLVAQLVKNPLTNWYLVEIVEFSSVWFSRSVVSNTLWPHGLHHARFSCPSPSRRVCSNSCPSSWWCHPNISSSVIPFWPCLQSFPASGSFPMSQFFATGGQNVGVSASTMSPSNEYSGLVSFRIDWFDLLSVQGTLKGLLQHYSSKASILQCSAFFMVQLIILVKVEILAYKFDCRCYSVAKSCLTLCDIMGCSTPGSFALHYCLEFA